MSAGIAELTAEMRGRGEWEHRRFFPPGPKLALCLSGGDATLGTLSEAELVEVAAAARRQTAWAQARELAAIAELARRRTRDEQDGHLDYRILSAHESVVEEVAAALSLTGESAATQVHLAERLHTDLPETRCALETGRIDLQKARAISDLTDHLPEDVAASVEGAVIEQASEQTTGQLRRRIRRVVKRLAPEHLERRKREVIAGRRLEVWETPDGTADLSLRDLAATDAHAIHNKITAMAHSLRQDGDVRSIDQLRADLAQQLLRGTPLPEVACAVLAEQANPAEPSVTPPSALSVEAAAPVTATTASASVTSSTSGAGVALVACTTSAAPVPPVTSTATPATPAAPAASSMVAAVPEVRDAADVLADVIDSRLAQVTEDARAHQRLNGLGVRLQHAVREIEGQVAAVRDALCAAADHGHSGYRPPNAMRRAVEARHPVCVFPSCNRRSDHCDLDHTIAWDGHGHGRTCPCNLAPLCRRHHRTKQSPGWALHQPWPGLLVWITPAGTWHIVRPERQQE
ncbi:HNH endonuclease signature motif containing protein [Actinomadura fibrosa]|uniref:DUF222 domain-containing protein n=1 Tax=Actinomadura fibrosa TaxID=111802 RepID=A0ABW2XKC5_9ACTN|nr:HNH endonuclease signature motif containing protein [Actinomadura fibrosa]